VEVSVNIITRGRGPRKNPRGTTLIELLVVIAIIAILMALVGVVAWKTRDTARLTRAKALVKRIHLALDKYMTLESAYPPEASDVWPSPAPMTGVPLPAKWVTESDGASVFNKDDFDPANPDYFIDPWGGQIQYRKIGPQSMLVWSIGPDKTNDITKSVKQRPDDTVKPDGTIVKSDDISNLDVGFGQ
jgi:prepilin-type N-terminal cleavage/methylation domain-containing protein